MNAIIMEEEAVNVKQSWEAYMGGFGRRESKAEKKLYFNVKKKKSLGTEKVLGKFLRAHITCWERDVS